MPQIDFAVTREEHETIKKIVRRADALADEAGIKLDRLSLDMDLCAAHRNGCPLKLDALLAADDANFGHDVFGIRRYMDRRTGKLTGCFLPRFAAPQEV